jgi:heme/copper-type cytochrome/quinol oxidase subunit 4
MFFLVISFGLIYGKKVFSDNKFALVLRTSFSTFILILGMVLSSDSEAGSEVWNRVFQIALAVVYVVLAMRVMQRFSNKENG